MRGQNSRALFAYPVGCIISFQLHFRFELIKKCNFRLVVFSIECCPSTGPSRAAVRASQVESGRGQSSRVESSLSSKLAWLFASSCPQKPMPDARAYIWCIYIAELSSLFWHCYKSAHWPMQQVAASWAATGTGTSTEMGERWRVWRLWTVNWPLGRLLTLLCCKLLVAKKGASESG